MFSAEEEAQLTKWGCPVVTAVIPLPDGESGYTDYRQPHDVLAWLNDRFDAANSTLDVAILVAGGKASRASKITAYNGIIERQHGWDFDAPDPYSAVYALAQAVMEAK